MTEASPPVEVLGAAWCPDTARTHRLLRRLRVPFLTTDVDLHLDALEAVNRVTGGRRRTPVVKVGTQLLVEPSNARLVAALTEGGQLAVSTMRAVQHGQNIGDLERWLRLGLAGAAFAATSRAPWAVRVPLRVLAVGVGLTAAVGWCPVYDAQGVTSVGGPGDHPAEAERQQWLAEIRRPDPSPEP